MPMITTARIPRTTGSPWPTACTPFPPPFRRSLEKATAGQVLATLFSAMLSTETAPASARIPTSCDAFHHHH